MFSLSNSLKIFFYFLFTKILFNFPFHVPEDTKPLYRLYKFRFSLNSRKNFQKWSCLSVHMSFNVSRTPWPVSKILSTLWLLLLSQDMKSFGICVSSSDSSFNLNFVWIPEKRISWSVVCRKYIIACHRFVISVIEIKI